MRYLLLFILLVCAVTDMETGEIYTGTALAFVLASIVAALRSERPFTALFVTLFVVGVIIYRRLGGSFRQLGEGDLWMMSGIFGGYPLAWAAYILMSAFVLVILAHGISRIWHRKDHRTGDKPVPFAPFLLLSVVVEELLTHLA